MASSNEWKLDEHSVEHPEKHLLLAFIRRQSLDEREKIAQHLSRCDTCRETAKQLEMEIAPLLVFKQATLYHTYPLLSPDSILAHAQGGVPKRTRWLMRKRQPARPGFARRVSWVSIPASFGMALLLIVTMVVLAAYINSVGTGGIPFRFPRHYVTVTLPPTSAATPAKKVSPTVPAKAHPSVTPGTPNGPTIWVCSSKQDISIYHLVICGRNFKAGDHVSLMLTIGDGLPFKLHPIEVSRLGEIQAIWPLLCRFLPTSIQAVDVSSKSLVSSNIITTISQRCFGTAPSPNTTPGAWGWQSPTPNQNQN